MRHRTSSEATEVRRSRERAVRLSKAGDRSGTVPRGLLRAEIGYSSSPRGAIDEAERAFCTVSGRAAATIEGRPAADLTPVSSNFFRGRARHRRYLRLRARRSYAPLFDARLGFSCNAFR